MMLRSQLSVDRKQYQQNKFSSKYRQNTVDNLNECNNLYAVDNIRRALISYNN